METVLDAACGTGELQRLLLEVYPSLHLVGVGLCESMIEIARARLPSHPHTSFHQAIASRLPFPDGHFDFVVSANSFHYFEDPVAALAEMRRAGKPGGQIIIMDWSAISLPAESLMSC